VCAREVRVTGTANGKRRKPNVATKKKLEIKKRLLNESRTEKGLFHELREAPRQKSILYKKQIQKVFTSDSHILPYTLYYLT